MKKINIISLMLLCLAIVMPIQAQNVSKEVKIDEFKRLDLTTVGTVYFTQSKKQSIKIEGKKKNVDRISVYVKEGTLYIEPKENLNDQKDGVNIYITAPDVKEIVFCGVGTFSCNEKLKVEDLKCLLEGVGKMEIKDLVCQSLDVEIEGVGEGDIHVQCDKLNAEIAGIGSLKLSGKTKQSKIERFGIGNVNTRDLQVGN